MLPNPAVRNKQDALRNQYAVLRWQVKNADLVLEDGIMPIVDYFRVFGNGRYLGKTKTMSFCLRKSREGDGRSGNRARGEEEDDDGDRPTRDYFRLLHSPDQVQFLYCRVLSELVVQQTDAPKIHAMEKSLSSRGSRRICRAPQPHTLSSSRTSRNLSPRYRTKRSQSSQPS